MSIYKISEIQPIESLYIKLPRNGNRLKLQTYNKTIKDTIKIEWLKIQPIVKNIVQNYNETSS